MKKPTRFAFTLLLFLSLTTILITRSGQTVAGPPTPEPVKAVNRETIPPFDDPGIVKPLNDTPSAADTPTKASGDPHPPGYTGPRERHVPRPADEVKAQLDLGDWFYLGDSPGGGPDIAYNYNFSEYLTVWTGPDVDGSGWNHKVHARLAESNGDTHEITYDIGYRMQNLPEVAYNPDDDVYLVGLGTGSTLDVQEVSWRGEPQGSALRIYDDVGMTAGLLEIVYNYGSDEYFVLFQDADWDLRGQRVDHSGTLIGDATLIRSSNCGGDVVYNWIDDRYLVVGTFHNGDNDWDVWGRILNSNGALYKSFTVEAYVDNQGCPHVSWNSHTNEYLVIWNDDFSGSDDIYGRRISASGARLGSYLPVETSSSIESRVNALAFNWHDGTYMAGWVMRWTGEDYQMHHRSYLTDITDGGEPPYPSKVVESEIIGDMALTNGPPRQYVVAETDTVDDIWGRFVATAKQVYLPLTMSRYVSSLAPDDSYIEEQWGLHNIGQTGGLDDADIDAPEAWYLQTGASGVKVAIIDSGVDMDHPEFSGRLTNGWDFVNNDSYPDDDEGHGTHVAGITAARGNNGTGIAGVAWDVTIIPLKVLNASGSGSTANVVSGIYHAVNHGAKVINLSLSSVYPSSSMAEALNYAWNHGVLVVAAAGNCGDSNYSLNGCSYQDQPNYPAAFDNALAVASTTDNDTQSSFSNQGSYVDVAAPGSLILSTLPGGYGYRGGTSMAAPFVSGLAALVYTEYPGYSVSQVTQAIACHVDDLGASGWDQRFGHGRINALSSLVYGASGCAVSMQLSDNSLDVEIDLEVLTSDHYRPGSILVKLADQADRQVMHSALSLYDVDSIQSLPVQGLYLIEVPIGEEIQAIERLTGEPDVVYAEPNFIVRPN